MSKNLEYDERVQSQIYHQKHLKPFQYDLSLFNKNVNGRFGRNKNKVKLPVPGSLAMKGK